MPYCSNCRSQLPDNATVCSYCGTVYHTKIANTTVNQTNCQQQPKKKSFFAKLRSLLKIRDCTRDFYSTDILNNRGMALLAYLGPLVILPLLFRRRSAFAVFHINQGIGNILVMGGLTLLIGFISLFFESSEILNSLVNILSYIYFGFSIIGGLLAFLGRSYELPVIGRIKIIRQI